MRVMRENIDLLMFTIICRTLYIFSLGNYSSQAGEAEGGSKWSHLAGRERKQKLLQQTLRPKLNPSHRIKVGLFPKATAVSTSMVWSQLLKRCFRLLHKSCDFPGLWTGVGRGRGAKLTPQQAGLGAACTGFLDVFRRKARKSYSGFSGLESPHSYQ